MSMPSNSATFMCQSMSSGSNQSRETFRNVFECWLTEQNQQLQELVSASKHHPRQSIDNPNNGYPYTSGNGENRDNEDVLRPLIDRVVRHHEQYYRAKSRWADHDVLAMLSPSWRSSLEDAFLWIGGWRPTMAFHLLYSKSGLQLEARLAEFIRRLSAGDLGDLSPSQLTRVDELQRKTVKEERELTEELARHQETVADSSMVELSHVVTELMENGEASRDGDESGRVESTLAPKEEGLVEILHRADDLRLRTLKEVLDILTPIQAVHFLIAAAELHLRLHDWGKKRDEANHQVNGVAPSQRS
ncbi:hypothetical protein RJ639_028020 [Escallonia herrerae]|uniref:DOG1 domain-containing protein n=1 Tax=Escallonia herrerae TaxID=1293975 RepID=A0AA88X4K4_9ASTE|nr:hypothetical protein RJ639_028020 [Escallonia herrerae]